MGSVELSTGTIYEYKKEGGILKIFVCFLK